MFMLLHSRTIRISCKIVAKAVTQQRESPAVVIIVQLVCHLWIHADLSELVIEELLVDSAGLSRVVPAGLWESGGCAAGAVEEGSRRGRSSVSSGPAGPTLPTWLTPTAPSPPRIGGKPAAHTAVHRSGPLGHGHR